MVKICVQKIIFQDSFIRQITLDFLISVDSQLSIDTVKIGRTISIGLQISMKKFGKHNYPGPVKNIQPRKIPSMH